MAPEKTALGIKGPGKNGPGKKDPLGRKKPDPMANSLQVFKLFPEWKENDLRSNLALHLTIWYFQKEEKRRSLNRSKRCTVSASSFLKAPQYEEQSNLSRNIAAEQIHCRCCSFLTIDHSFEFLLRDQWKIGAVKRATSISNLWVYDFVARITALLGGTYPNRKLLVLESN